MSETARTPWIPPEHEWKPGDSLILPPVPEAHYPPDAVPLEPLKPQ
jgi:hypothetical protein